MSDNPRDIRAYDDIIDLPRPLSAGRPRMSAVNRAAQFLPFAALSGYDDAIRETARQTDERAEPDEQSLAILDAQCQLLADALPDAPEVTITYFLPDAKKSGGSYRTVTGAVKKIDTFERTITLFSGARIPMDDIAALDGDLFKSYMGENA